MADKNLIDARIALGHLLDDLTPTVEKGINGQEKSQVCKKTETDKS